MNLIGMTRRTLSKDILEESRSRVWKYPGFIAELFDGVFRWDLVHPFPEQVPDDKRQGDEFIAKVRGILDSFVDPNEVDRTGEIPEDALLALSEIGCFGMTIPREYGGLGLSSPNYHRVLTFTASYSSALAVCLAAHQSLGVIEPLKLFGTPAQKQRFLPLLAKGALSGLAYSETGTGVDPGRVATRAEWSDESDCYLINGEKLWCTNGPKAEYVLAIAMTLVPGLDGVAVRRPTAFIIETDMPGLDVAHRSTFIGLRGVSNGVLVFRDYEAPLENVLGKPGDGLRILLATLTCGRLALPSIALAHAKRCLHFSHAWSCNRTQWDAPIGQHQAVAHRIADMLSSIYAMESMHAYCAAMADDGWADIRLESALTKVFCSEAAWRIASDFVQIRGGRGVETVDSLIQRGEEPIPAERILRDSLVCRVVQGTNDISRLLVIQEVMDSHLRRMQPLVVGWAAKWPDIMSGARFFFGWYLRHWLPILWPSDCNHISFRNRMHLWFAARAAKRCARSVIHAIVRRQQHIEKEQVVLCRLADIGALVFAMTAVLSRTENQLKRSPKTPEAPDDLQALTGFFCLRARQRINRLFADIRRHDGRPIARLCRTFMHGGYNWLTEGVYRDFGPSLARPSQAAQLYDEQRQKQPEPAAVFTEEDEERMLAELEAQEQLLEQQLFDAGAAGHDFPPDSEPPSAPESHAATPLDQPSGPDATG